MKAAQSTAKAFFDILIILDSLFLCGSCISPERDINSLCIDNCFTQLDMSIFHNFVDHSSVSELNEMYGKPNRILDAEEVVGIEGYTIYEYDYSNGKIDCYIKKDAPIDKAVVDYIYYEPNCTTGININDFVVDKQLQQEIIKNNPQILFLYDLINRSIVRISFSKNNQILNIALNDINEIQPNETIQELCKQFSFPIQFNNFGEISNITCDDKTINISIAVHLTKSNLTTISHNNPGLQYAILDNLFADRRVLAHLTHGILNEKKNIYIHLLNKENNDNMSVMIDNDKFQTLFTYGVSNKRNLESYLIVENALLPEKYNSWLTAERRSIEHNCVNIPWTINVDDSTYQLISNNVEEHIYSLFIDKDNPDIEYLILCSRNGYDIQFIYHTANHDDLKWLITKDDINDVIENL